MPTASDPLLSPEAAQALVLEHIEILGAESVPLAAGAGRVLAATITARTDIPPLDSSAMDGYAVRFADVSGATADSPVRLRLIEDIPAGTVGTRTVQTGQASRIMTGAPLPHGADTVIRVEYTRPTHPAPGSQVELLDPEALGANVRRQGEDMAAGAVVLGPGARCGPAEIGALAALGHAVVAVRRQPRVAILSTGDELVELGQVPGRGQIVNSNSHSLAALARSAGALPTILPLVGDRQGDIRAAVHEALSADLVVSSGGVSVGEHDLVKAVLAELGAHSILWRVAMKPGKPLFFCTLQDKPYFGLPGNPVSSMISFLQFVQPAIRKATGVPEREWRLPEAKAVLDAQVRNRGDRREYLRAHLRLDAERLHAVPLRGQGSHMLTSMMGANGLVLLAPGQHAAAGDTVPVQIFGPIGVCDAPVPGPG